MRVAFLAMAAVVLVLVVLLAANIARHALSPQSTTKVHVSVDHVAAMDQQTFLQAWVRLDGPLQSLPGEEPDIGKGGGREQLGGRARHQRAGVGAAPL